MRSGWGTFLFRLLALWVQYFLYPIRHPFRLLRKAVAAIYSKMHRLSDVEDELECKFDSTWEEESGDSGDEQAGEKETARSDTARRLYHYTRNVSAARDMQNYRHDYPEPCRRTNTDKMNLKFYLGKILSSPDDFMIQDFHTEWWGDYERLEYVHSYIQWLFPLQEAGMNYLAYELTKEEIKDFCDNEDAMKRLKMSYKLMLDFYGIELVNETSGEVQRAKNWKERFKNLNRNTHNNLRITRILKCLGDLGYKQYQAPLVRFFLHETLVKGNLENVKRSVIEYFIFSIRNKQKRQELLKFAFRHYRPREEFVWCPRRIQRRLKQKEDQKSYAEGKHPRRHVDCNPYMSEGSPANVDVPMEESMETSDPSETDVVDEERETEKYHVESADNETKAAAKELTHKELSIPETEQTAEKTDEAISPVKQVGQGLKLVNLIENSMDGNHNNHVTNHSKTDAASPETVCENMDSPKVVVDQVMCHINLTEDSESQGLTDEVSKTYSTSDEQLGSGNVHEEMALSHINPATEKRSFNAPADQEASKSSLGENGIPRALSETVEGHSSQSGDAIPRVLSEKVQIQSSPAEDATPTALPENVESHCSFSKDRIPCALNEEAESQSAGYSMEPKTE
ncbi:uncharacterized protein [Paramormyrops kingsleyae]|uniref:Opioid growth factor receptor-like protein 1 n=1 Tax=Paramormyrops kingsleyae TaxID=1676925 RepID=A0A3B3RZT7_9TELE|nr:opioid growth factor receptor-like protein 1 [Paramormyrops kingsleyae]